MHLEDQAKCLFVTVLESLFLCTTYHSFMCPLLYHKVHLTPLVYTTLPFPYIYYP
jgi:hypothetical protein